MHSCQFQSKLKLIMIIIIYGYIAIIILIAFQRMCSCMQIFIPKSFIFILCMHAVLVTYTPVSQVQRLLPCVLTSPPLKTGQSTSLIMTLLRTWWELWQRIVVIPSSFWRVLLKERAKLTATIRLVNGAQRHLSVVVSITH